jgi:hypothetical protein
MAIEGRLRELGVKHQSLEKAIHEEVCRPAADAARLTDLKRRKLRLKEQIEQLKSRPN